MQPVLRPAASSSPKARWKPHLRQRTFRPEHLRLSAFICLVALLALLSLLAPSTWWVAPERWLPAFIVLTVTSIGLEFISVPLPRGGELSMATITHVAAVLLLPAPLAAVSVGIAVLVEEVVNRVPLSKLLFNVFGFVLTTSVISIALGIVGSVWVASAYGAPDQLRLLLLFLLAGGGYYVMNAALTSFVISIAMHQRFLLVLRLNTRNTGLSELGAAAVGALFALIWTFEPLWTILLGIPAAVISRSLHHIRLLQTETRSAVRTLAQIVDDRDTSTFHHSERVSVFATAIARALELDEDEVDLISQAAVVHDLGKIGVPDRILLKPGALTREEQTAMWLHTEIGAKILSKFEHFRAGSAIVLHHHEAYDGSGYPGRLAGEQIPLGARVVAVADTFDAMTSDRPYRAALPVSEALDRLRAGAGVQWDPEVVGAFIKLVLDGQIDVTRDEDRSAHGVPSLLGRPVAEPVASVPTLVVLPYPEPSMADQEIARA